MTVSQTFLLAFSITVTSHQSFVTSEQTCVTPTNPCDWPDCPQGDPGWRHKKIEVTIDRGDVEDTIILDWANTVLYPNLITGLFFDKTYYRQPQNPLKITTKGPICKWEWYDIKLAYNIRDDRGIDLCYSTKIEIDPHPNEYMLVDKEVPMKKVELSEDTYKVEWLKDMFHPQRYERCATGWDGQNFMNLPKRVYYTKIPFCSQVELDYKFFQRRRHTVTKILKADCNKTQEELDSLESRRTGWNGTVGSIGIYVSIIISVLITGGVAAGFIIRNRCCQGWHPWQTRGGAVHSGPHGFQTQPVPPANVYIYRPGPDNLQSGPYIPCSQAHNVI